MRLFQKQKGENKQRELVQKPSLPKGVRDFSPQQMLYRNHIFSTIKHTFELFGFLPLETPAMENLSVLTGKYGDEGDRLIFKILNSGNYLEEVSADDFAKGTEVITKKISEKALRYDLTVPFARFVATNKGSLTFPFKRYQIQPVWRADRPQKGRYREFYQCDADVVGSNSLLFEAEIMLMIQKTLTDLGLIDFTIKINSRKILTAMADLAGVPGQEGVLCVAIDKIDKIGFEGVEKELLQYGFSQDTINKVQEFIAESISWENPAFLKSLFASSEVGTAGVEELLTIAKYLKAFDFDFSKLEIDLSLARGLGYYTGAIFEVKVNNVAMGSISGGGRYDNLTGVFGSPGLSGVGFSFGVDRIYDVMLELGLFNSLKLAGAEIMVANMGKESFNASLNLLQLLRNNGIKAEMYPEFDKLKKQFSYADNKSIAFVAIIGSNELAEGKVVLKNMSEGSQDSMPIDEVLVKLKSV